MVISVAALHVPSGSVTCADRAALPCEVTGSLSSALRHGVLSGRIASLMVDQRPWEGGPIFGLSHTCATPTRLAAIATQLGVLGQLARQTEAEGVTISRFELVALGRLDRDVTPEQAAEGVPCGLSRMVPLGVPAPDGHGTCEELACTHPAELRDPQGCADAGECFPTLAGPHAHGARVRYLCGSSQPVEYHFNYVRGEAPAVQLATSSPLGHAPTEALRELLSDTVRALAHARDDTPLVLLGRIAPDATRGLLQRSALRDLPPDFADDWRAQDRP